MMNFDSLQEAKKYVREMSVEDTEEIGSSSVILLHGGDIEIVAIGEECSDPGNIERVLGTVTQVLCG